MAEASPLLSIAIPTFNRAELLRECLESILCSIRQANAVDVCEVVVSNNAGTDPTPIVVDAFVRAGARIRYTRLDRNIGPHANFRAAAAQARSIRVGVWR